MRDSVAPVCPQLTRRSCRRSKSSTRRCLGGKQTPRVPASGRTCPRRPRATCALWRITSEWQVGARAQRPPLPAAPPPDGLFPFSEMGWCRQIEGLHHPAVLDRDRADPSGPCAPGGKAGAVRKKEETIFWTFLFLLSLQLTADFCDPGKPRNAGPVALFTTLLLQ